MESRTSLQGVRRQPEAPEGMLRGWHLMMSLSFLDTQVIGKFTHLIQQRVEGFVDGINADGITLFGGKTALVQPVEVST